jgi:hypothetical protein
MRLDGARSRRRAGGNDGLAGLPAEESASDIHYFLYSRVE